MDNNTEDTNEVVEDTNEVVVEDKPNDIPEARFKEVIGERNASRDEALRYQGENAQLRNQLQELMSKPVAVVEDTPKQTDIDELRRAFVEATIEGETDKALRMQERLDSINAANTQATMNKTIAAMREDVVKQVTTKNDTDTYNRLIKETVTSNPALDQNSTTYDAGLTEQVNQLTQGFYNSGMSMTDALVRAVDLSIQPNKPALGNIEQRKSNIAEEQNRPPKMKTDSNKVHMDGAVDISKMSDGQFREFMQDDEAFKKAAGYYS